MAISTCIKCGGTSFEIKENEPRQSAYKLMFVQCSNCGGVVRVMDYLNIGSMLQKIDKKLTRLSSITCSYVNQSPFFTVATLN